MPAEKIVSSTNDKGAYVRVSWGKDHGDVQLVTAFDHEQGADTIINIVNDWLKAAGLEQIPGREELNALIEANRLEEAQVKPTGIGFDGFHVFLHERREVNDLIRAVKRGRDDSMGRDE